MRYGLRSFNIVDEEQRHRTVRILQEIKLPHYKSIRAWYEDIEKVQQFHRCSRDQAYRQHMLVGRYFLQSVTYKEDNVYSPVLLYWHCLQQRLPVTEKHTIEDMRCLLSLRAKSDDELRLIVTRSIASFSRCDLLRICMQIQGEIHLSDEVPSHEVPPEDKSEITNDESTSEDTIEEFPLIIQDVSLETIHEELHDVRILQSTVKPSHITSAVGLAAIRYHLDISMMHNPVVEYQCIRYSDDSLDYTPHDNKYKDHYLVNPNHYNLFLHFNSYFPRRYYTDDTLRNHALMYGKVIISNEDLHAYCSQEVNEKHFYVGRALHRDDTLTSQEVDTVSHNVLLHYDSRHITCQELTTWWSQKKQFLSPFGDEVLRREAVTRLRQLLFYRIIPNPMFPLQPEEIEERNILLTLIDSITLQNDTVPKVSPRGQGYLRRILKLGMYMRGWVGKGAYPLSTISCYGVPVKDDKITQLLVEDLTNLPKDVENLELYLFHHGVYIRDNGEYNTLGSRINLLRQENIDHPDACIRTSSNYLIATCYRVVGEKFDIRQLDYIH